MLLEFKNKKLKMQKKKNPPLPLFGIFFIPPYQILNYHPLETLAPE